MKIKNRIRELRYVLSKDLLPNPKNWRTHPKNQQDALRGILSEVGISDACLARELPDGSLMLIDGHLRAETLAGQKIPVLILDVNEAESDKILATLDPLSALAGTDAAQLDLLLRDIDTGSESLQKVLADLADDAGLYQTDSDEENDDAADQEKQDDLPTPAGVRMVQLFLDDSNIGEFQEQCRLLSEHYATSNITDTVLEAIKRESTSLQN